MYRWNKSYWRFKNFKIKLNLEYYSSWVIDEKHKFFFPLRFPYHVFSTFMIRKHILLYIHLSARSNNFNHYKWFKTATWNTNLKILSNVLIYYGFVLYFHLQAMGNSVSVYTYYIEELIHLYISYIEPIKFCSTCFGIQQRLSTCGFGAARDS